MAMDPTLNAPEPPSTMELETTIPFVFRLPAELIASIFSILIQRELEHDNSTIWSSGFYSPVRPQWTAVLQVCKVWRSIALSDARLWAYIYFGHPKLVASCVRRSGAAPLHFTLRRPEQPVSRWKIPWKHFYHELHRICHLEISTYCGAYTRSIHALLKNHELPSLETLILQCGPMFHDFEGHGERSTLLAPLKLDRDSMPRLRTLRLRFEQIQVTLSSNIFSGLTTLEVRDALCWKTWEMPTLISCMREWTQLETLNLWWSLPEANITQYPVTRPKNTVTLPNLRRLDLGDMTLYADHFLRHLELHPGTSVHFDGEWHNGLHPADYSDVFRSLVSSISAEVLKPIRGLTIRNGYGEIEVYGFLESELELLGKAELGSGIRGSLYLFLQVDFNLDEEEVEVDLDLDPNEPRIQACQILSAVCGVLSVRELEVLRVQLHIQPEFLEWEPILRPIDNVKKVIIDSHRIGTSRFLDALAGSTYESTDGWEPVLPRLEELVIIFIIQYADYDIPFDNVLHFLKSRLARGVPIKSLVLEDRRRRPATKDKVIEELARLSAVPGVVVVWKLEVDDDDD